MEPNHNLMISRREVLGTLFRYKWSIAAIIIGTFALATFLVYFLISPSFASRAVIIINSSYLTQPLRDAPPDSDLEKLVTFHTQRDVLESQRLAEEAVKRTNLGETRVIGNIERIKMFVGTPSGGIRFPDDPPEKKVIFCSLLPNFHFENKLKIEKT